MPSFCPPCLAPQRLLVTQGGHACVLKKAALCLLRLFRTNPECVVHADWAGRLSTLLEQVT